VGTNTVILPGAYLGDGCSVAAMSLVMGRLQAFGMYAGVPAKRTGDRSRKLLELERGFREARSDQT